MSFERKTQRGIALVTMALWMTAFMAFAVVGVDIGRVAFTANEVQAVADIAATAGAGTLAKGGSSGQAKTDAQGVVAANAVDGSPASIATSDVETGGYDYQTATFQPGANPSTAVRATGRKTVRNMIAGVLGSPTSDVTKVAVAGFSGKGEATPNFPIALGDCNLPSMASCFGNQGATCATLTQIPSTGNNTGWTTFSLGNSEGNVDNFLPIVSKGGSCVAPKSPNTYPTVSVGQSVNLTNGQLNGVLNDLQNCISYYQGKQFTIPVVDCDNANFSQSATITGFATIVFDSVGTNSSGPHGINIRTIFTLASGGLGGCPTCGYGQVALLK